MRPATTLIRTVAGTPATLPSGVEVYLFGTGGTARRMNADGTSTLDPTTEFLRFIDDGQLARYFIGDATTSPERPSNATYKMGLVRPHSAFTPHAHAGEHFVLSLGYAICGMYDPDRHRPVEVLLPPSTMVRIPAMLPHSFGNRAHHPLIILAANTGFGIDHEDYAITAAQAERRAAVPGAYPELAKALRDLEAAGGGRHSTTWRERAALVLRRIAERWEGGR